MWTEERDLTANTLLDRETWGLDDGGSWLSRSRSTGNLMETRSIDTMNRLTRTGGAGSTVVEGQVNELSTVSVNGQPAEMRADPVAGGYRFRRSVPVSEGANTITVTAADTGNPPATTTKSWSLNVPAVARNFTYDANGNTLSDGQRTFTWDAKNRLRTVTKNGTTWKWDYDYRDRRVREYTNGALTKQYVWSGTEIIQERNGSGAITRTHYFGGFVDGPTPASGTKYQTLNDHLGHIREVLAADGAIAARYDYTPYQGPVKIGASTVEPTFLTIGRYQHHAGSGLELALYRAYDPELGRWLSEDPIGEAGGLNLYGYVGNAPSTLKDPDGREPVPGWNDKDPRTGRRRSLPPESAALQKKRLGQAHKILDEIASNPYMPSKIRDTAADRSGCPLRYADVAEGRGLRGDWNGAITVTSENWMGDTPAPLAPYHKDLPGISDIDGINTLEFTILHELVHAEGKYFHEGSLSSKEFNRRTQDLIDALKRGRREKADNNSKCQSR